jgi:hypothetical protein
MLRTRTSALLGVLSLQLTLGCGMEPSSGGDPDDGDPGTGDLTADGVGVDDQSVDDGVTSRYKLHFFPRLADWDGRDEATGVLMVARDGKYIFAGYARGGPEVAQGTASRTPRGIYGVAGIGPKLGSSRWPMSLVQWGSTLTVDEDDSGHVTAVYTHSTGLSGSTTVRKIEDWKLSWVNTKDFSGPVGLVFADSNENGTIELEEKTVDNMIMGEYVRSGAPVYTNDFGHMSIDLGKNGVFIHPTTGMYEPGTSDPTEECASLSGQCELRDSHGCLHVAPALIDHLLAQGWVRKGTSVTVHAYSEAAPAEATALLASLADIDGSPIPDARVPYCGCDWRSNACEVAVPGTTLDCTCDIDCY